MVSKTININETSTCSNHITIHFVKHCHGNGFNIGNSSSLYYVRISWRARTAANFVYRLHALFIYMISEDVLSGNSTIFGVTGAI